LIADQKTYYFYFRSTVFLASLSIFIDSLLNLGSCLLWFLPASDVEKAQFSASLQV